MREIYRSGWEVTHLKLLAGHPLGETEKRVYKLCPVPPSRCRLPGTPFSLRMAASSLVR